MRNAVLKIIFAATVLICLVNIIGCSNELACKTPKIEPVVGKWELTSTGRRGPRTNTLTINEDMTATYQGRRGEIPVTDLKIEGDQLSFAITMKFRDREFAMTFNGTVQGPTLKGLWTTSRGTREVTGKKIP